jgi:hypothetical protein
LSALEVLPRLARALLGHAFAYAELLCQELDAAVRTARRRLLGAVLALIAALMALLMGCVWVIAATWDGPDRLLAVGALCIGFALIAFVCGAYAGGAGAQPFARLRAEWHADIEEIARLDPTLLGRPPQTDAPAAQAPHGGRE